MHKELQKALEDKNYEAICEHLCTKHYSSDGDYMTERVVLAFIQGWMECEKYEEAKRLAELFGVDIEAVY